MAWRSFLLPLLMTALSCLCLSADAVQEDAVQTRYYRGLMDERHPFAMHITRTAGMCGGSYFLVGTKNSIALNGPCDSTKMQLFEGAAYFTPAKAKANSLLISIKDDGISGVRTSASGTIQTPIAGAVAEPSKIEYLRNAIGAYRLVRVIGFEGANSISEIDLVNERWKSSVSSLVGGMRQGHRYVLTDRNKQALSSLRLIVNADLSLSLMTNRRLIATFPYTVASAFDLDSVQIDQDRSGRSNRPAAQQNFHDGLLHIATSDAFKWSRNPHVRGVPWTWNDLQVATVEYGLGWGFTLDLQSINASYNRTLIFAKQ